MPLQVGIFESSGMVVGADRRFRHQLVSIVTNEELRWLEYGLAIFYSLFGVSTTLPANFGGGTVGVAFGEDLSTPPTGDPISNPTGPDWLSVQRTEAQVLPRSEASVINGYELRISIPFSGRIACPRRSGTARSIWLVTSPVDVPPQGGGDWTAVAWARYASHGF